MSPEHPAARVPGGAAPSAADVRRLLDAQLSLPSRLGHTLLLLAGAAVAGVTGALLLTEAALPLRTRVALGAVAAGGAAWAAFAAWVLARRRVLFAAHRVLAARLAVGVSSLFALGAWAATRWGGTGRPGYAAVVVGLVMVVAALVLLRRARDRRDALERRRAELERQLGVEGGSSR
jgi:hypothetical protein